MCKKHPKPILNRVQNSTFRALIRNIENMIKIIFSFFFFWIIKNLLPKGQSPTNNHELQEARFPKKPKNGQHLPYKHRNRGISPIQNQHLATGKPTSPHTGHKIANQTRPHKQVTEQLYQLKQAHTPAKKGKQTINPAHIPGSGNQRNNTRKITQPLLRLQTK